MTIKERFFQIGGEWTTVHLPSKPNGFAIFIIGDINHFVKQHTSSWHQRPDQYQFIQKLKEAGYTIIYSNLYGRNWGSDQACRLLERIYYEVMKTEILNKKAHIISEGMGALVAAKLLPQMESCFRSVVMINPCLSLKHYFNTEKNNKFFYKRILRELKQAYDVDESEVETMIAKMDPNHFKPMKLPIKIFHHLSRTPYSLEHHIRPYEQRYENESRSIDLSILLETKTFQEISHPTISFLSKYEKPL